MCRGERLIKLGPSWFLVKSMYVKPSQRLSRGRATQDVRGSSRAAERNETPNTRIATERSQSLGAKVQGQEGNSPDRR